MAFLGLLKDKPVDVPITPERRPRILIGVAGFHGVVPEAQENFFELAYNCGRRMPEYDFFLKLLIKREQYRARNNIVELAVVNGCDWILMLDDDMIVPPDLLVKLMAHNKDVIGALYFQRGGAYHPVIMKMKSKKDGFKSIDFINHHDPIVRSPGLHQVDGVIGGGCMLFKTEVFNKIPQPYFWIDGIVGTDVHVCDQLRRAGVEIWVDTSIELGHVGDPQIITSRTIPQYGRELGEAQERLWNDLKDYYLCTSDELESRIVQAAMGDSHQQAWDLKPRDTWEGVLDYYQMPGDWHVCNLAFFCLRFDQAREWAITEAKKLLKAGATVVDYGAGIGFASIELARLGFHVVAMDLAGTETLKCLEHRAKRNDVVLDLRTFDTPTPRADLEQPADALLMISVLDHLWDPMEALRWATRNVKPGGWMLCDTVRQMRKEGEPQHLVKYDPHQILKTLTAMGWRERPENPFLFVRETDDVLRAR